MFAAISLVRVLPDRSRPRRSSGRRTAAAGRGGRGPGSRRWSRSAGRWAARRTSTTAAQASALASAVGRDARAVAGVPLPGRGVVAVELGVDRLVAAHPGGDQPPQQRPAQVGVDGQARRSVVRAVEQAGDQRRGRVGSVATPANARTQRELVVAARLGGLRQAAQRGGEARPWPSARWSGSTYRSTADAACRSTDCTVTMSVSAPTPLQTSWTKSRARISASRVMSQAALQHSARASESSSSPSEDVSVASERSSSRIFA